LQPFLRETLADPLAVRLRRDHEAAVVAGARGHVEQVLRDRPGTGDHRGGGVRVSGGGMPYDLPSRCEGGPVDVRVEDDREIRVVASGIARCCGSNASPLGLERSSGEIGTLADQHDLPWR
jgi:hypothetical protein